MDAVTLFWNSVWIALNCEAPISALILDYFELIFLMLLGQNKILVFSRKNSIL